MKLTPITLIKNADIDVVILCGGLGTRLRPVLENCPKAMAPIGDQVFLEVLLQELQKYGFRRFILCVGHLNEQIQEYFRFQSESELIFSIEHTPLGTGGAVKNAIPHMCSETLLILNGDSLCEINYHKFYEFHLNHQHTCSMVLSLEKKRNDGGNVSFEKNGRITSFREKISTHSKYWISAGIYLMQFSGIKAFPSESHFSLEYDVFPKWIRTHQSYGFPVDSEVFDIGTPERYEKFHTSFL